MRRKRVMISYIGSLDTGVEGNMGRSKIAAESHTGITVTAAAAKVIDDSKDYKISQQK